MAGRRDTIITKRPRLSKVHVREWAMDVYVPKLSPGARVELTRQVGSLDDIPEKDAERRGRWLAKYFIAVACDEAGKPLFSPEDEDDIYQHAEATAVETVVLFALRANSIGRDRLDALGNAFGEALNGASPSGSQATSGA